MPALKSQSLKIYVFRKTHNPCRRAQKLQAYTWKGFHGGRTTETPTLTDRRIPAASCDHPSFASCLPNESPPEEVSVL